MSTTTRKVAVVIGVGPGLGLSIAHRFGREGYDLALISRSDTRHAHYVASLAEAGIQAAAFVADVRDHDRLLSVLDAITQRYGRIDLVYFGAFAADFDARPTPITQVDAASVQAGMRGVYPAIDVVGKVLPGMTERGDGVLLFAGGLSAVVPMPALGSLAVPAAALRNYVLTLNAGLAEQGIYAGTLTIGGLVERGDIHQMMTSQPPPAGDVSVGSLNPDDIAEVAWELCTKRDRPEATFTALA